MSLLKVDHLSVSFVTRNGTNQAVDDVSFAVEPRQITAIIGESGSGKSVSCYAMLGLVPSPPGRIDGGSAMFQGQDLLSLSESELRAIRGRDVPDAPSCLTSAALHFHSRLIRSSWQNLFKQPHRIERSLCVAILRDEAPGIACTGVQSLRPVH